MTNIEPGLLRIFRYFTGIALIYFAAIVILTAWETGQAFAPSQIQSYLNFVTNLVLFGYLSWPWLQRKLKHWYLPVALMVATVVPVFSNLLYLAEPQLEDLTFAITRSWLLFPILVVPLVLIAWQYRYRYVVLFVIATTLVELSVLLPLVGRVDFETLPILGAPLIRAFAFGTVGYIVSSLTGTQRAQRKELVRANIQLSQHANTLEELAISRERNRLARDLHDTLAHTLSGLAVNLEAIKMTLPPEQDETRTMLDRSLRDTRAGLAETRRALKDLRAKQLEDMGLRIAIRKLASDAASRAGFALRMEMPDHFPDLPSDVEECVYRITQEALENIVHHARASQVALELGVEADKLTLEIADNGSGFALSDVDSVENMGIKGMQERADMVGGKLTVSSNSVRGTTVHFMVEVPDDQSVNL